MLNAKFAFKPRHEYTPVKFHPPIDKKCSKKDRKKTLFCPLLNCPIACLKTLAVIVISHIPPFRFADCFFCQTGRGLQRAKFGGRLFQSAKRKRAKKEVLMIGTGKNSTIFLKIWSQIVRDEMGRRKECLILSLSFVHLCQTGRSNM